MKSTIDFIFFRHIKRLVHHKIVTREKIKRIWSGIKDIIMFKWNLILYTVTHAYNKGQGKSDFALL